MRRFRPNVVFEGCQEPWEEEGWLEIVVRPSPGSSEKHATKRSEEEVFYAVARCNRCPMPNMDPNTAVKDPVVPFDVMKPTRSVGEMVSLSSFSLALP